MVTEQQKVDSQNEWLKSLMHFNDKDSEQPANAEAWEVHELCRIIKELQINLSN